MAQLPRSIGHALSQILRTLLLLDFAHGANRRKNMFHFYQQNMFNHVGSHGFEIRVWCQQWPLDLSMAFEGWVLLRSTAVVELTMADLDRPLPIVRARMRIGGGA